MSRTINVLAPAPIRHVPARTRSLRTSYVPMDVEVELTELSRSEAPEGPHLITPGDRPIVTHLVEGAAWRPVGSDDAFRVRPPKPRDPVGPDGDTFVAWLEGRAGTRGLEDGDLGRCLEGSPLLARIPNQRTPHRPEFPWNVARQGTLTFDTRAETPDRVRNYVAGNLALIDGKPFMRLAGPLVQLEARYSEPSVRTARIVRHPGAWTTNSHVSNANLHRFDHVEEMRGSCGVDDLILSLNYDPAELDGLVLRDDDDIELMLRESIRILASGTPKAGYPFAKDTCERLEIYSALGSVGAIDRDDAMEAWEFVRSFSSEVTSEPQGFGWIRDQARRIGTYAEQVAIPRLRDRATANATDMEFLTDLRPF